MSNDARAVKASFRDPSGFVFKRDGYFYRQINPSYRAHYEHFISSGLYTKLTQAGLLVSHAEMEEKAPGAYKIIRPEQVPFISYPYEWSFGFYRDAALATLEIQKTAIRHGMTLKDASAYNIQLVDGKPKLIDTLSFELLQPGKPWVAYRQFCQHFLAPLALTALTDIRLGQLMRVYIDGIPLDLASRLLPRSTYLNFGLLMHIHLHAKAQQRAAPAQTPTAGQTTATINQDILAEIASNLGKTIQKLAWKPGKTEWGDYYNITNYTNEAQQEKQEIIRDWVKMLRPQSVWDMGANDGRFSRIGGETGAQVVAFDIDPLAVEKNYQMVKKQQEKTSPHCCLT